MCGLERKTRKWIGAYLGQFLLLDQAGFLGRDGADARSCCLRGPGEGYVSLTNELLPGARMGLLIVGSCCSSGTYFLPGPVGVAFFNDPCTMVVLVGVGMEGSENIWTLRKR
jgi:hypothetical protein